jgi:hypothetical protein
MTGAGGVARNDCCWIKMNVYASANKGKLLRVNYCDGTVRAAERLGPGFRRDDEWKKWVSRERA